MKKLKKFFAFSTAFCIFMTSITPALAKTSPTEIDTYVLNFAGEDIAGYENYDQRFMHPSPHYNYLIVDENDDGINESHWNYTGHKTMNMINTSLIKEGGEEAYASIPVYCLDAITSSHRGHKYKRVNLEDATYFSNEKAKKIRAVMSNVFPFETNMEALEDRVNSWNPATDSNAVELTEAECITAAQTAIWKITNDIEIKKYYFGTDNERFTRSDCLYPEYLNDPKKASDSNATNIELLTKYLLDLEPIEADNSVISKDSFINYETIYFTDLNKTLLKVIIEANITNDSEIYLYAEYKETASEKLLIEDGINEYNILFEEKIDNSTINLILEGKQYGADIYLYEPYFENGETARSASQTMAGYSAWTLPVKEEIYINFEEVPETTSTAPKTEPETTIPEETTSAEQPTTIIETTTPKETTTLSIPDDEVEEVVDITPTETLSVETEEVIDIIEETTAEFDFGVLGENDENTHLAVLPETGDNTNIWLWLSILSGSILLLLSIPLNKKE